MKNQENKIAANKRLAELLGWSNLIEVAGALIGTPPAGAAESRGQAMVPDWAGDWAVIGPLATQHQVDVLHNWGSVHGRWGAGPNCAVRVAVDDIASKRDAATRMALTLAVIAKLEDGQ
ncbi:hypothetical protein ACQ4WP_26975 [Janthinobacterium sp. GB4P2]|uniref:hypothetical protein n=1 Tax=Janthinobacterium sp. GB4P2 TaxID=3424189 RepID=UPI003F2653B1